MRLLRNCIILLGCAVACRRTDAGPTEFICPKPPNAAIPVADTVAVGDTVRFHVPAADLVHTPARAIDWSSSHTAVATISAVDGLAKALTVGFSEILAVDQNSAPLHQSGGRATIARRRSPTHFLQGASEVRSEAPRLTDVLAHGHRNMPPRLHGIRVGMLFALGVAGVAAPGRGMQIERLRSTAEPAHVAIVGTDYAFVQLPSTLRAGPTLFSFENRGTKRHEMSIALLKPGVAVESLLMAGEHASVGSRAVSDSIVGFLIARPGESSGGQLFANLIAGRDYVVICTLKDTPDARQHSALGMIGSFRVQ